MSSFRTANEVPFEPPRGEGPPDRIPVPPPTLPPRAAVSSFAQAVVRPMQSSGGSVWSSGEPEFLPWAKPHYFAVWDPTKAWPPMIVERLAYTGDPVEAGMGYHYLPHAPPGVEQPWDPAWRWIYLALALVEVVDGPT